MCTRPSLGIAATGGSEAGGGSRTARPCGWGEEPGQGPQGARAEAGPRSWVAQVMNSKLSSYLSAFSDRIMIMSNPKNVFRSFLFQGGAGSAL